MGLPLSKDTLHTSSTLSTSRHFQSAVANVATGEIGGGGGLRGGVGGRGTLPGIRIGGGGGGGRSKGKGQETK